MDLLNAYTVDELIPVHDDQHMFFLTYTVIYYSLFKNGVLNLMTIF